MEKHCIWGIYESPAYCILSSMDCALYDAANFLAPVSFFFQLMSSQVKTQHQLFDIIQLIRPVPAGRYVSIVGYYSVEQKCHVCKGDRKSHGFMGEKEI